MIKNIFRIVVMTTFVAVLPLANAQDYQKPTQVQYFAGSKTEKSPESNFPEIKYPKSKKPNQTLDAASASVLCGKNTEGIESCWVSAMSNLPNSFGESTMIPLSSPKEAIEISKLFSQAQKDGSAVAFADGKFTNTRKPFVLLTDRIEQLEKRLDACGCNQAEGGKKKETSKNDGYGKGHTGGGSWDGI